MFDARRGAFSRLGSEEENVNPGRARAFGDQVRARERAINYFTLLELVGSPAKADEAWASLDVLGIDSDRPLGAGAGLALGRLDVDDAALKRAAAKVRAGFEHLHGDDLILELGMPGYPSRVALTEDAPTFLFVRQDANVLEMPSIAIVGTREASEEGRARARKLAQLLVKRGIAIASGLAKGIDVAAHQGAIDVGGVTIAVIGTPLTRVYPKEHADLQRQIGRIGAVVSQFAPSSKTQPLCFPLRNATMSALSLGSVVIEASETSGSLIQARKALQQGRKLFIPRSAVENVRLTWPRKYESLGAHVFSHIDDLVGVLERENLIPLRDAPSARPTAIVVGAA